MVTSVQVIENTGTCSADSAQNEGPARSVLAGWGGQPSVTGGDTAASGEDQGLCGLERVAPTPDLALTAGRWDWEDTSAFGLSPGLHRIIRV